MCRAALLVGCLVSVLAVCFAAEVPLTWVRDGEMRDAVAPVEMTPNDEYTVGSEKLSVEAREFASEMPITAAEVFKRMYVECVQMGSFACVKPKVLSFLSSSMKKEVIPITENLAIEKSAKYYPGDFKWSSVSPTMQPEEFLERVEAFLAGHELKLRIPKEVLSGEMLHLVPKFLLKNIPSELRVPLSEDRTVGQERGYIKKIIIPFLLGLKLKASALLPLALTLIALKTWKALTLGLLSLVLSGALIIFKFTKPKVVNYEVVHLPHHPPPQIEHHGWEHQGYGRSVDAQQMAYSAHSQ